jgi:hypothetical protein
MFNTGLVGLPWRHLFFHGVLSYLWFICNNVHLFKIDNFEDFVEYITTFFSIVYILVSVTLDNFFDFSLLVAYAIYKLYLFYCFVLIAVTSYSNYYLGEVVACLFLISLILNMCQENSSYSMFLPSIKGLQSLAKKPQEHRFIVIYCHLWMHQYSIHL